MKSVKIQCSSEKILTFLINDILDFAQIRSGKFRKNCQNINVRDAAEEIKLVQEYKAKTCGVNIEMHFQNFDDNHNQENALMLAKPKANYEICMDYQRFQQVLLNLVSNALKFTPRGGSIDITSTYFPSNQEPADLDEAFIEQY